MFINKLMNRIDKAADDNLADIQIHPVKGVAKAFGLGVAAGVLEGCFVVGAAYVSYGTVLIIKHAINK